MRSAVLILLAACSFEPGHGGGPDHKDGGPDGPGGPADARAIDAMPDAPKSCAASYADMFNGHHYRATASSFDTWDDARTDCAADGGHLVKLEDSAEDAFVATLAGTTTFTWIGLYDKNLDNSLYWTDGTQLGAYNNFPSATVPMDPGGYDCGSKKISTGTWSIYTCSTLQAGICECE